MPLMDETFVSVLVPNSSNSSDSLDTSFNEFPKILELPHMLLDCNRTADELKYEKKKPWLGERGKCLARDCNYGFVFETVYMLSPHMRLITAN